MPSLLTLGVLVALTCMLYYIYAKYNLDYWKRKGVVQLASPSLIFGHFRDAALFRTPPGWHLGILHRAAPKDARYVGFYIFHKPCLLLTDPQLIKQMLLRDFENFSDRHFAGSRQKDSMGMKNLFGLKNPTWRYLRKKMTPTLAIGKVKQMLPLMLESAKPMMEYLEGREIDEGNAKIVDAQELNYKYATDLIANVALGTPTDSFNYPNAEFSEAVDNIFHGFKRMLALTALFFVPEIVQLMGPSVLSDSKFVSKIFWKAVKNREETGERRGDFIDSVIQLKNGHQDPHYRFEGDNLLYQTGTFFSGFETSSTATSFTLMQLALHPEIQEKARKDIVGAFERLGVCYEAYNEMKYLEQCISEGIRLHPPVSTLDRNTKDSYKIPGTEVVLEAGTGIFVSLYGLGWDPKYFENPQVFDPERHAKGNKGSDAYIPFGCGPRMCIGIKLGQLHAKIVLAMILRDYEVTQMPEYRTVLNPRSTFTTAARGIKLHFRKISNDNLLEKKANSK